MYRLLSSVARLVVVGLILSIFALVPALACAGPVGPVGPAGSAGPVGPVGPAGAAPQGAIPMLLASPTSVAISASDTVNLGAVTFTGAGWGENEQAVYIEMLLPGGQTQMLIAALMNGKTGAFSTKPAATNVFKVAAGVYTVRGTGMLSGKVAYIPFTIAPKPAAK